MCVMPGDVKRTLLTAIVLLVAVVALLVWLRDQSSPRKTTRLPASSASVSRAAEGEGGPPLKAETRRAVGAFDLAGGRRIHLSTADTSDGTVCLIEEEDGAESSTCLEGGLFAMRRAELLVGSQGGPERFSELHVTGIAAPGVRGVALVKTDGGVVRLDLSANRAFVFESPDADLTARIYPTALRLYGPNGRLVETVSFPPGG